jgi:hypothetical protein
LSVRHWRGGELDRARIDVATRHTRACQRSLATRAPAGLCRGLDGALSAASVRPVGAGGVRLHRQAPGVSILGGATMGGSRAAASGDGTPWRTTADATAQGGRRTRGRPCGAVW